MPFLRSHPGFRLARGLPIPYNRELLYRKKEVSGKTKSQKRIGRAVVIVGTLVVLGGAAAVVAASRLRGDDAVLEDIDHHFETVALITSNDDGASEPGASRYASNPEVPRYRSRVRPESGVNQKNAKPSRRSQHRRSGSPSSSDSKGSKADSGKSPWKGIRRVAPGTYEIDPNLVAKARQNPRKYLRSAGAVPMNKDGRLLGFQIFGIRKGDPLHALGFRDGDLLASVNGYKLDSVENAALAASALRFAEKYRVDLLRGGGLRSFYYRVGKTPPEKTSK